MEMCSSDLVSLCVYIIGCLILVLEPNTERKVLEITLTITLWSKMNFYLLFLTPLIYIDVLVIQVKKG